MSTSRFASPALSIAVAGLLFAAAAAHATVTAYTDAVSFAAAVTGATSYDFDGVLVTSPPGFAYGAQTIGGVTFDSTGGTFTLAVGGGGSTYGKQFFSGQSATAAPSDVLVSLAGTHAIAFTYGAYLTTAGTPITFTLSTGDVFTQNLPPQSGTDTNFMGFVSTTTITGLTLATVANVASPPPYAYTLDVVDFTVATPAAAVPEPSQMMLMVAGFGLGAGVVMRRRRQR